MSAVREVFLFLLVTSVCGQQKPKWCIPNNVDCGPISSNFTCENSNDCVSKVVRGETDIALASLNDMVNNVKIVMAEEHGLGNNVKYYGVAVVWENATFNLKTLEGKKSCHTGAGKKAGWVIPIGYLLRKEFMPFKNNQYESAADYFGGSCVPGVKEKTDVNSVEKKLCELCKSSTSCSLSDGYADHEGAFKCMAERVGQVAFVKQSAPEDVVAKGGYGERGNYKLLCKDGSKKEINEFKKCHIDARPAAALVTKAGKTVAMYVNIIKTFNITAMVEAKILYRGTLNLTKITKSTREYLGDYYLDYNEVKKTGCSSTLAVTSLFQVFGLLFVFLAL